MRIELKKIGNSSGFILPKEFISETRLRQGDWFDVTVAADGSVTLRPSNPVFQKGMAIAERAMDTYRNALEELAK
jgi:putative addiction module antidote